MPSCRFSAGVVDAAMLKLPLAMARVRGKQALARHTRFKFRRGRNRAGATGLEVLLGLDWKRARVQIAAPGTQARTCGISFRNGFAGSEAADQPPHLR